MSHKLGQVFLHDNNIIRKICTYSGVTSNDHVVEIGCGAGILTEALSKQSKTLHVIEIDEICINKTKERLPAPDCPITYIHEDFLLSGLKSVPHTPLHVVANIPYYISAKIMKQLILDRRNLDCATLMVQKEFAEKLLAKPGEKIYTSLNIYLSYFFAIERGFTVSKTCFIPRPKIDSMVIKLRPHETPPVRVSDENRFFRLVRSAFWGRRKPLRSCLSKSPYLRCKPGFSDLPFFKAHPECRGESLSLADFADLFEDITPFIIDTDLTLPDDDSLLE